LQAAQCRYVVLVHGPLGIADHSIARWAPSRFNWPAH
jgi:hypothetical protein